MLQTAQRLLVGAALVATSEARPSETSKHLPSHPPVDPAAAFKAQMEQLKFPQKLASPAPGRSFPISAISPAADDPLTSKLENLRTGKVKLTELSDQEKDNPKIVSAALGHDWRQMESASARLRKDPVFVKNAIEKNGLVFKYADKDLRENDRALNLLAVKHGGTPTLRETIHPKYLAEEKFLLEAFTKSRSIYLFFPDKLKSDRKLALEYAEHAVNGLEGIPEKFQKDPAFLRSAVQRNSYLYQQLPESLQLKEDLILAAVSVNPRIIEFIPKSSLLETALLEKIALTSLPSRDRLITAVGKLPDSVAANYEKLEKAYQILKLNSQGFKKATGDAYYHRFDNSRAIIRGRYQVGDAETQKALEKVLGKEYFAGIVHPSLDPRHLALAIFATVDGNGAHTQGGHSLYSTFNPRDNIDNMTWDDNKRVVFYECPDMSAVEKSVNEATDFKKYQVWIGFINAHGSPGSAHLSGKHYITVNNPSALQSCFGGIMAPGSVFIWGSCSVGQDRADGKNLANTFHSMNPQCTTYAPKVDGNLAFTFDGAGEILPPEYNDGHTRLLKPEEVLIIPAYQPVRFAFNPDVKTDAAAKKILDTAVKNKVFIGRGLVNHYSPAKEKFVETEGAHIFANGELVSTQALDPQGIKAILEICVSRQISRALESKENKALLKDWETTPAEKLEPLKKQLAEILGYQGAVKLTYSPGKELFTLGIFGEKGQRLARFASIHGKPTCEVELHELAK